MNDTRTASPLFSRASNESSGEDGESSSSAVRCMSILLADDGREVDYASKCIDADVPAIFVAGDNDAFINKRSSPQDEERDVTFD